MSNIPLIESPEAKTTLQGLFEEAPLLVEVRFPGCATSPNWHLIHEEEELEEILATLTAGAVLYLNPVWALQNPKGAACLRKGS